MAKWGMLVVLAAALIGGAHADAAIIDFELDTGGLTPVDDAPVLGSYTIGATVVTFGFDTTGDGVPDTDGRFEDILGDEGGGPEDEDPLIAFEHPAPSNDTDASDPDGAGPRLGEAGEWMLRRPFLADDGGTGTSVDMTTDTFIVSYSGLLPRNVAGQIWDLDGQPADPEEYTVEIYNTGGFIIDTRVSSLGIPELSPGSLSGLPWNFSFVYASEPIAELHIHQTGGPASRGFAFDNFDALGETVIPEPTTLALLAAGGFALLRRRRRKA